MVKAVIHVTLTAVVLGTGCATFRSAASGSAERDLMAKIVVAASSQDAPTLETIAQAIGAEPDEVAYPIMKLAKRGVLDWDGAPHHLPCNQPVTVKKLPNNTSDGIRQPADGSPKPSR
jgi:hypothetical protein